MAQKYGSLANAEEFDRERACLVCDEPRPVFSWTDFSGEGYCVRCGTPYQLKWGTLKDGEAYPRINIAAEWIPIFRRFWSETNSTNGAGTFIDGSTYQDQMRGRRVFNDWLRAHESELPKKPHEEPASVGAVARGPDVSTDLPALI